MKVYLAGINHFDPLGRAELERWLKDLAVHAPSPPAFISVEWSEPIFADVQAQRHRFRHLAQREWPEASTETLDTLAAALAYEADTHTAVFPGVETLWLDQGREHSVAEDIVARYAEYRLNMYSNFLANRLGAASANNLLPTLSEEAWRRVSLSGHPDSRDKKWAQLIRDRVSFKKGDWAVVITGATHTSDQDGSLRRRLERDGLSCEVTILRPSWS